MKTPNEKMDILSEAKWELFLLNNASTIPERYIDKFKKVFAIGYQNGQADMMDSMRDIYDDDPCEFDEFFHIDNYQSTDD